MRPQRPSLNEKTAAIAWARAFNTHDLSLLAPLVDDRLCVSDQLRWNQMLGGKHYLTMLGDYFECVPLEPTNNWMEIATLPEAPMAPTPPRPCVVEYRHGKPTYTILFRVHAGKILHIERRLLPPPTACRLSGIYPGLDTGPSEEVN